MVAYYNEFDSRKADWLENLIRENLVSSGVVDRRSIVDVEPTDLHGFYQIHLFAGIGGWSLGARLAGWPDNRRMWTGSCPCQPFSKANAVYGRRGRADERHLLPEMLRLVAGCRPPVVFGEQVKDAIELGWLDELADGMERLDYAWQALPIPACGVGSPQERERLWFVCDANGERLERIGEPASIHGTPARINPWREATRAGGSYRAKGWVVEPGLCRLVDGLPAGMDHECALEGLGNAIVPQVAAQVIGAYMDCLING